MSTQVELIDLARRSSNLSPEQSAHGPSMRISLIVALTFGFAASLPAEFLVPDREYRCPPSDHACQIQHSQHPLSSYEEHQTTNGNKFTINFVEYNDKGQPWNPRELTDAEDQVRS